MSASDDPTSIINILLMRNNITQREADYAITHQGDRYVGQALLEIGAITETQLEEALLEQRRTRMRSVPKRERVDMILQNFEQSQEKVASAMRGLTEDLQKIAPHKRTT